LVNSQFQGTNRFAEQSLEVDATERGSRFAQKAIGERDGANGTGAGPLDERGRYAEREKPLDGENPGRGSGMKQARKADGGASRRGVEKTRGRNAAGVGERTRTVDNVGDVAKRAETQAGVAEPKGEAGEAGEGTPKRRRGTRE